MLSSQLEIYTAITKVLEDNGHTVTLLTEHNRILLQGGILKGSQYRSHTHINWSIYIADSTVYLTIKDCSEKQLLLTKQDRPLFDTLFEFELANPNCFERINKIIQTLDKLADKLNKIDEKMAEMLKEFKTNLEIFKGKKNDENYD